MFRDLEEDPFFADPFCSHRENLHQMMNNFPGLLGEHSVFNLPDGGTNRQRRAINHGTQEVSRANDRGAGSVDPFQSMNSMMEHMRKRMFDMQSDLGCVSSDPNGHSLNTSNVMTYAKVGNEPPKVFQASSHVHRIPGGIIETRRAVKDSESGVEKMSIGHHIKDRAHVIQKSRNQRTGDEEMDQDFINLSEADASVFDQEWQHKVSTFMPPGQQGYDFQDIKNAMEGQGQRKCRKHSAGQAASVERKTELTCQVDDLSSELEDVRDEQLLRRSVIKDRLLHSLLLPLVLVAILLRALLLHA
ncbi:myeloid leukemia factor 1 isoform X2 [Heptranchias perlo]|uniref:myeloid leukemia factor 1 isoform X2 n=1 Tax=Heptranchias perlo TaxID=212740 RepID=UPI003559D769